MRKKKKNGDGDGDGYDLYEGDAVREHKTARSADQTGARSKRGLWQAKLTHNSSDFRVRLRDARLRDEHF